MFVVVLFTTGCSPKDGDGPRAGAWQLTGEDTNGQTWSATFGLQRTNATSSGNFVWKRNGSVAGEEAFTGTYNAAKKIVTLRGTRTSGTVVAATYIAVVSSDLNRMTDGTWTGPGPSGTWQAERVAD